MKLDTTPFESAIAQLEDALKYCASDLAKKDLGLALHLRAAAIQAFEFTYELSIKMLKRYLNLTEPTPTAVEEMSFNELIRTAYGKGLISSELIVWKEYRKKRGITSYTYDEEKAQEIFNDIPAFLKDVKFLLATIKQRQERSLA